MNLHLSEVWEHGGEGGIALAEESVGNIGDIKKAISIHSMRDSLSLKEKIGTIAKEIYGARRRSL